MSELSEIVGAIRQVEVTIERRAARAEGTFLTLWGLGVAAIFLFYREAHANPALYRGALGPLVDWMWLAPFAVCYAATLVLGARLAPIAPRGRRVWQDPYAMVGIMATATLVLGGRALGHHEWSTAGIVLLGGAMLPFRLRAWGALPFRFGLALAAASAGAAVLIVLAGATHLTHLLAALFWGLAWPAAGALVYRRGG
ncbi:MAG TPA: hypothetical protein VFH78_07140 [Candidatus Thermoplasmatota archaeon]|nr:hypothetical protein [Candidatus Thermoplasmatota archaeon]